MPFVSGFVVDAGQASDWVQEVIVTGVDTPLLVTPQSGKLTIHYEVAGDTFYWNGSTFINQIAPIELATTISGVQSRYAFAVPAGLNGKTLIFKGWINNDLATLMIAHVQVGVTQAVKLKF